MPPYERQVNSNIPEMLGEMDEAIRDIWQRYVESVTLIDWMDWTSSYEAYRKLVETRDKVDGCLGLLDDLRLKVLPLLPDEEREKEN